MLKQAWRSYWASLHPRYLRKAYDSGVMFQIIYWLVIYPTIMGLVNKNSHEMYAVMAHGFVRIIPFFIMAWSDINSKYLMPKVMYLSPMKEQDREEYIKNVLFVKIGMTVFLGLCIEVIWGLCTGFDLRKVLVMGTMNLSMGVATYISQQALKKKNHWLNNIVILCVIIAIFSVAILEVGAEKSLAIFLNWFILIATTGLLIIDIWIVRNDYQTTVVHASEYELAFKVLGKVEPKEVKFDLFEKKE